MNVLNAFNAIPQQLASLSPEMRALLERDFGPDVRRLEELLGRPANSLWFSSESDAKRVVDAEASE